jgi:nicotinamide-nucleotide amidase
MTNDRSTIAVLTIGDELINGEMADTNTAVIAGALGARGYLLRESLTVGDEVTDIVEALRNLSGRRDVVIVTGGLGPTADDLTARAAARAFGRPLVLNEEALTMIRDHFRRRGREMTVGDEKQALLPQEATILSNPEGTAPGFLLRHQRGYLFFLPGVPREMTAMLEASVLPRLLSHSSGTPGQERVLKIFGISEPKIEEILTAASLPEGVRLAFGVDFPLVHAKLRASGEAAGALLDRAELEARKVLGDAVVACGRETLAENVVSLFVAAGRTLSLAESCTGGLIAKLLTDVPGASAFFERGAVTYANSAKQEWLGVSDSILQEQGAVSEDCALAMARGMRDAAGTDLALAVTGIAGPGGGTEEKPVGTVYLALATPEGVTARRFRFSGTRERVRLMAAHAGLDWLRRHLATGGNQKGQD